MSSDLNRGGPQGCSFGLLEYKSNSNDNANHVEENMRYKFVDDLSLLEKLNLILLGLSEYNFKTMLPLILELGRRIYNIKISAPKDTLMK